MIIDVITPFPKIIEGVFQESILKQAQKKNLIEIDVWDLRSFTNDKHYSVDDAPYGGGAGMILMCGPIFEAVESIQKKRGSIQPRIIFMTPQGRPLSQKIAWNLTKSEHMIFICGHYRGVDQRVIDELVTDEISIGDYILTGGELPAAVVIDAVIRLLPGVLGNFNSAQGDSFENELLDHPHYTRPEVFRDMKVPGVLLSGHHGHIEEWRYEQSVKQTRKRRPDLLENRDG